MVKTLYILTLNTNMKLLDVYSLTSGSKIDKPFIYESYFPLPFEKYVTFQAQTKFDSKDYSYWQDVINLVFPLLEKNNIKIIQVGNPNEWVYQYTIDLRGRTNLNQLAYVLNRAILHFGSDSLGTHLASNANIPLVSLYSASSSSISGPHFGDKNKQIIFDAFLRAKNGKPSYSSNENPKSINLIKPEEIANAILKLLNIDFKIPFETIHIGEKYSNRIIREFIPNNVIQLPNPEFPLEIRMDLEFNEEILSKQLSLSKALIITKKRINKNILVNFKSNIVAVCYEITENDEPKFVEDLKTLGLGIYLISYLDNDTINNKKINYYEFGVINQIKNESESKVASLKEEVDKLYYKCNKIMFSDSKVYMGNLGRVSNQEIKDDFTYYKVIDSPEFWKDLQFLTVIKKHHE